MFHLKNFENNQFFYLDDDLEKPEQVDRVGFSSSFDSRREAEQAKKEIINEYPSVDVVGADGYLI